VVIFLSFAPLFVILTISYEGLFYLAFSITLVSWVRLEHRVHIHATTYSPSSSLANTPAITLRQGQHRPLTLSDFRISLFFLYLLQSGFFSTGNIASVSSFSLDAVYRLLPVFDPFSQGALLLLKILIPFALISVNLGILNIRLGLEAGALFGVVAALGDVLTMNFFWMVKDEGSWLEIGMTISHFVIASLLSVFVAALESMSEVFVGSVSFESVVLEAVGEVERAREENGNGVKR
jgi:GPI ethanolamine phosphate transferase 1